MKTLRYFAAAVVAVGLMAAPANAATTFVFKGDGNNVTPLGVDGTDYQSGCASTGDFCSVQDGMGAWGGLDYSLAGINLTVNAYKDAVLTRLIQDIQPQDSGLGAWSEDDTSEDQTQANSGESIEFIFDGLVRVTDVEFNSGADKNCSSLNQPEGPCGEFQLDVYAADLTTLLLSTVIDITGVDILASLGAGARFVLTALTDGGGFAVAKFSVEEVPVPAALPLLLSGLAGLGFASRRRKMV